MAGGTDKKDGAAVRTARRRHRHSPLVRRLAAEYDVDPDGLTGSGPRGRVTRADVLDAARRAPLEYAARVATPVLAAPGMDRTSPLLALLGKRLVESLRAAALATRVVEVDVTGIDCVASALRHAVDHALLDHPGVEPIAVTVLDSGEALFETAVVRPPQVAVLTAGTPARRPVAYRDGSGAEVTAIRDMVYLAFTYDQRAVEPAEAASFLVAVRSGMGPA